MKITTIDAIAVDIPYRAEIQEPLRRGWGFGNRATDDEFAADRARFDRELAAAKTPSVRTTVYRVHTDAGLTGLGEGRALKPEALAAYTGRSPFEFLNDDGPGPLQIEFYDLMGQHLGLPLGRILGPSRPTAPLAWWSHCFPPELLRAEAQRAAAAGYRVHKFKRRAHTDVVEQIAAMAEVTPPDYEITIDANETFGTRQRALDTGRRLQAYPQLHCMESPIDQGDIEGYHLLKRELGLPLAIHLGKPEAIAALHSEAYDYYILGTAAASLQRQAALCAARNKPFWMQLGGDGTDISTLWMLHLAAAIPNATKGHVSMQHLQEALLLKEPLVVVDGEVTLPTAPGLGGTLNLDAVERYRV